MEKLISIITPCYNVEKYIDRCIRSIVRQTLGIDKIQLIMIDDASTDGTWKRMKVWEKRFPDSIVLIHLSENIRQGGARNTGLKHAVAPYIGFVDADDWIEETMYEKLYNKIIEYKCDMSCCKYIRDHGDSKIVNNQSDEGRYIVIQDIDARKRFLIEGVSKGGIWSRLFRKELIFENNAVFPEKLTYEDNYFMSLIDMHVGSIYVVEEILYHYFVNQESTVLKKNSIHHLDRMKIEMMKLLTYKSKGVYETYKDEIEFKFIKLYYLNTMNILLLRFDQFPVNVFEELKETVKNIFPDYKLNPYMYKLHQVEQALLMTLDKEYDSEGLKGLGERYRELYEQP